MSLISLSTWSIFFGWMSQGGHYEPLLLLALFYWCTSSWTCRTTPCPWSRCPPGQFFWLDELRESFWTTFTFSTFLLEHSFRLKSYRWGGVGGPWDFIVSPSPFGLDFGTLDLGLWTWAWQKHFDPKRRTGWHCHDVNMFSQNLTYFTYFT